MLKVKNTFVKLEGIYVVKTHDRKRKIILRNNGQIFFEFDNYKDTDPRI